MLSFRVESIQSHKRPSAITMWGFWNRSEVRRGGAEDCARADLQLTPEWEEIHMHRQSRSRGRASGDPRIRRMGHGVQVPRKIKSCEAHS